MNKNLEDTICKDIEKIINEIIIKHVFDKIYIVLGDLIEKSFFNTLTDLLKNNTKNININIIYFSKANTLDFIETIDNPNINTHLITLTNNETEINYFSELNDLVGFETYYEINPIIKN